MKLPATIVRRSGSFGVMTFITLVLIAALAPAARAAKDDIVLASRANGPNGRGGDDQSFSGGMSANGRFVVFLSFADNLSGEDIDDFRNVFVRDLQANTITLASRASGAGGTPANADSFDRPRISGDGRFVAFDTNAPNMVDGGGGVRQVYVRDLLTDTTTVVSRASGANGAIADANASVASISADGRLVAFTSHAGNLSGDMTPEADEVYVRDTRTHTTTLVSRATGEPADGSSFGSAMSADGRFVLFDSLADNLSAADKDRSFDVFVRDLQGGSPAPPPPPPPHDTTAPAVTRLSLTRRRIRFTVSEPAGVRVLIARCRRHHRCRAVRSLARPALAAGPHRIRLRRALVPGRYRVTVIATDRAGNAATLRSRVTLRKPRRPRPRARRGPP